ncbi:hypothetical protein KC19_7G023400 [Ceratodon purpureus]|uniref:RNA methyltransferase n=1 Tax=Ceratodon purpureus TaxID=3225 RepID=A0A8T0H5E8_CERPU|nr:hypothetical protein KC19_7G023400 [Ceratodon purpureus]
MEKLERVKKAEKKYTEFLKNGGVLNNTHVRFDEETSEVVNEDKEVVTDKKRKYDELNPEAEQDQRRPFVPRPYGNEKGYYKKRIGSNGIDDPRLLLFEEKWFKNMDVLDVGCHEGYIAITLAQMYTVKSMHGVDIDERLITKAYEHLEEEAASPTCALPLETINVDVDEVTDCGGDETEVLDAPCDFEDVEDYNLLERVSFETANFLEYEIEEGSYDTVLCLSVTKWVQLNWGDEGLMTLFYKIFAALRPGGVLILEPQPWKSYRKNRKRTETIHENYLKLSKRPDEFTNILIKQVGFNSCQDVTRQTPNSEKGFGRPIYLYTK